MGMPKSREGIVLIFDRFHVADTVVIKDDEWV